LKAHLESKGHRGKKKKRRKRKEGVDGESGSEYEDDDEDEDDEDESKFCSTVFSYVFTVDTSRHIYFALLRFCLLAAIEQCSPTIYFTLV